MFGKWFDSAYTGSMAGAGADVFAVWTYAIARADISGYVELNPLVVGALIGMPVENVARALEFLQQPDPKSRNPLEEGRRLIYQSGHLYFVVSKSIYRNMRDVDERRDYLRDKQKESRAGRSNDALGYVYYAKSNIGIKIGFSKNPWSRVHEMRCFSPDVRLLAVEKGTARLEKERHEQFKADRIEREWFRLTDALVDHIKELATTEESDAELRSTTSTTSTHTDTDTDTDIKKKRKKRAVIPLAPEELAGTLPLIDGSVYEVSKTQVRAWSEAFPGVNVRQQLKVMKAWCEANPADLWTRSGIGRAIFGWLKRDQDNPRKPWANGGTNGRSPAQSKQDRTIAAARQVFASLPALDFEGTHQDRGADGGGDQSGEAPVDRR